MPSATFAHARFIDLVLPFATSIRFGHATNSSSSHSITNLRKRIQNVQPAFSLYLDFVDMTVSKASYGVDGSGRTPIDVPVERPRRSAKGLKLEEKSPSPVDWYRFGREGPERVLETFRSWNARAATP